MEPKPAASEPSGRLVAIDVVRGFALLGIFTMNITLGLPGPARLVPTIAGGFTGTNYVAWVWDSFSSTRRW